MGLEPIFRRLFRKLRDASAQGASTEVENDDPVWRSRLNNVKLLLGPMERSHIDAAMDFQVTEPLGSVSDGKASALVHALLAAHNVMPSDDAIARRDRMVLAIKGLKLIPHLGSAVTYVGTPGGDNSRSQGIVRPRFDGQQVTMHGLWDVDLRNAIRSALEAVGEGSLAAGVTKKFISDENYKTEISAISDDLSGTAAEQLVSNGLALDGSVVDLEREHRLNEDVILFKNALCGIRPPGGRAREQDAFKIAVLRTHCEAYTQDYAALRSVLEMPPVPSGAVVFQECRNEAINDFAKSVARRIWDEIMREKLDHIDLGESNLKRVQPPRLKIGEIAGPVAISAKPIRILDENQHLEKFLKQKAALIEAAKAGELEADTSLCLNHSELFFNAGDVVSAQLGLKIILSESPSASELEKARKLLPDGLYDSCLPGLKAIARNNSKSLQGVARLITQPGVDLAIRSYEAYPSLKRIVDVRCRMDWETNTFYSQLMPVTPEDLARVDQAAAAGIDMNILDLREVAEIYGPVAVDLTIGFARHLKDNDGYSGFDPLGLARTLRVALIDAPEEQQRDHAMKALEIYASSGMAVSISSIGLSCISTLLLHGGRENPGQIAQQTKRISAFMLDNVYIGAPLLNLLTNHANELETFQVIQVIDENLDRLSRANRNMREVFSGDLTVEGIKSILPLAEGAIRDAWENIKLPDNEELQSEGIALRP